MKCRSASNPSFSPDGKIMAYLTETTGVTQVWRAALDNLIPHQVSFFDERVASVHYSPVAKNLLFCMDRGGNENMQMYLVDEEGALCEALTEEPDVMHLFGCWSSDGKRIAFSSNSRNARDFDVQILDIETRERSVVLEQDGRNAVMAWLEEANALIVHRLHSSAHQELFYLDLNTGKCRKMLAEAGTGAFNKVVVGPDKHTLYLLTDAGRNFVGIATIDLRQEDELKYIVTPDWDVEAMALSPCGTRLAYSVNEDGYSSLHLLDLATGADTPLDVLPEGVIGLVGVTADEGLTWHPDGTNLAVTFSAPDHNPDIWMVDTVSKKVRQLTYSSTAGIPKSSFVRPELIRYSTFDGMQLPALYFKAKNTTKPAPVLVFVHGGPASQSRPSFNAVWQYFINRGYAVFVTNVRGSIGYGKEYMALDDVEKRMDSVKDLAYGAEWIKKQPGVDPNRIAVMGGSYGGFMVLSAITNYPDLWSAAVNFYGIADFVTFLKNTSSYRRAHREAEYGSLEHDLDFLREISPIHYVEAIKCPLLVVHGTEDPRVPFSESEQLVEKVRAKGGTVETIYFNDEGHGIVKLENKLVAYGGTADFLDKHMIAE